MRMPRDDDVAKPAFEDLMLRRRNSDLRAEQRLHRGRAEADNGARLDARDFRLEPWLTRVDLADARLHVNPPAASWLPFEMLDRVGHVHLSSIEAGVGQRFIEQRARGPDKRAPGAVFGIARLFADEHDHCGSRPLAEDRLGCVGEQRTGLAPCADAARPLMERAGGTGSVGEDRLGLDTTIAGLTSLRLGYGGPP